MKWKKIYVPPRASSSCYSKHCAYVKEDYAMLAIPAVIWCGLRSPYTNAPEKPHGVITLVGDPRLNFDFCMITRRLSLDKLNLLIISICFHLRCDQSQYDLHSLHYDLVARDLQACIFCHRTTDFIDATVHRAVYLPAPHPGSVLFSTVYLDTYKFVPMLQCSDQSICVCSTVMISHGHHAN